MSTKDLIPQYEFSSDTKESIPFKLIPLEVKTEYDISVPHRHNYYEIFMFFGSNGDHMIDFEIYNIANNCIHFVSPGQVHRVSRGLGTHGYVILFSRSFVSMQKSNQKLLFDLPFLHSGGLPVINLEESEAEVLKDLIESIQRELDKQDNTKDEIIRSYLKIFLMQSERFYRSHYAELPEHSESSDFRDFRLLLEKHFTHFHKVKDYSDLMGVSDKKLNEICKKAKGKTVSELIADRIVLEAKRLLKHSKQSTKEIAYYLNYSDSAQFSKFFKSKTGQSPSEFRA